MILMMLWVPFIFQKQASIIVLDKKKLNDTSTADARSGGKTAKNKKDEDKTAKDKKDEDKTAKGKKGEDKTVADGKGEPNKEVPKGGTRIKRAATEVSILTADSGKYFKLI